MNITDPIYTYKCFKTRVDNFEKSCEELIASALSVAGKSKIVRMVFFGSPLSNTQYVVEKQVMESFVYKKFHFQMPAASYISQPPLDCALALEVTYLENFSEFKIEHRDMLDTQYIVLSNDTYSALICGGISMNPVTYSIREQCKEVFMKLSRILRSEGFEATDIVRQWNYIEKITAMSGELQNYQCFNDVRTYFYSPHDWSKTGYPAATGIGTTVGGIIVEVNAVKTSGAEIIAVDNALQIPAHDYSQKVLKGEADKYFKERTTPKFERGKTFITADRKVIYISGTAAIRGELSQVSDEVLQQTITTLHNIDYLVSPDNVKRCGAKVDLSSPKYLLFRAYIKHRRDAETVVSYMSKAYPDTEVIYVHSDVCRDELLVEIEGIAQYS